MEAIEERIGKWTHMEVGEVADERPEGAAEMERLLRVKLQERLEMFQCELLELSGPQQKFVASQLYQMLLDALGDAHMGMILLKGRINGHRAGSTAGRSVVSARFTKDFDRIRKLYNI